VSPSSPGLGRHADKQDLLKEDELPLRQISLEEIEPKLRDETVRFDR
jgi:hypothetical protein